MQSVRPPLDLDRLERSCLSRSHIGLKVVVLDETASTNDYCHQLSEEPVQMGLAVLAERQTSGRGQHGRQWTAPARSSLLLSLLLRPVAQLDQPRFLTAWTAVSVACLLDDTLKIRCKIKWPNDVLFEDQKLCGILVERRRATVVGMGLNVSIMPHELPDDLRLPATSVEAAAGQSVDRTTLTIDLLNRLDDWMSQCIANGPGQLYDTWESQSLVQPGERVRIHTPESIIDGTVLTLRPDVGAILRISPLRNQTIDPERLLQIER